MDKTGSALSQKGHEAVEKVLSRLGLCVGTDLFLIQPVQLKSRSGLGQAVSELFSGFGIGAAEFRALL